MERSSGSLLVSPQRRFPSPFSHSGYLLLNLSKASKENPQGQNPPNMYTLWSFFSKRFTCPHQPIPLPVSRLLFAGPHTQLPWLVSCVIWARAVEYETVGHGVMCSDLVLSASLIFDLVRSLDVWSRFLCNRFRCCFPSGFLFSFPSSTGSLPYSSSASAPPSSEMSPSLQPCR